VRSRLRQVGSQDLRLVREGGIDKNHSRQFRKVTVGEQHGAKCPHRVGHEHVRRAQSGVVEQGVQVVGDRRAGARQGARIAEADPRPVVGADPGDAGDLRLDQVPGGGRVAKPGFQDHGRLAVTLADEVQAPVRGNFHKPGGFLMEIATGRGCSVFHRWVHSWNCLEHVGRA